MNRFSYVGVHAIVCYCQLLSVIVSYCLLSVVSNTSIKVSKAVPKCLFHNSRSTENHSTSCIVCTPYPTCINFYTSQKLLTCARVPRIQQK